MQKQTIMISEGAMFLRAEIKDMLADEENIELLEASSGEETSAKIDEGILDVLLINVDLCRGEEGFSVKLSRKRQKKLKILVLGTVDNLSELQNLISQGAQDYLIRPFEASDLKNKLEAMHVF